MNILIAGQTGPYPDRLLTLRDRGHRLFYCTMPSEKSLWWLDDFGDETIPRYLLKQATAPKELQRIVERHKIDVVYALKNAWDGSLQLTALLLDSLATPIVRHYKEHFLEPSAIERRTLTETARQIYVNEESLRYFVELYGVSRSIAHILDADYVPARFMGESTGPKLFDLTGEPHVLIAGSVALVGRTDVREMCRCLAKAKVHVHIYGRKYVGPCDDGGWRAGSATTQAEYEELATDERIHLHDGIHASRFTEAWSRYDVGMMHLSTSFDQHARFQRLNQPNRLAAYLTASLPLAQQAPGQDAMERLVAREGFGFTYRSFEELAVILRDRSLLRRLSEKAAAKRWEYTVEANAGALEAILLDAANTGSRQE